MVFCDGKGLAGALALGAEGIFVGTAFAVNQESPIHSNAKSMYLKANAKDATLSTRYDDLRLRSTKSKKWRATGVGELTRGIFYPGFYR